MFDFDFGLYSGIAGYVIAGILIFAALVIIFGLTYAFIKGKKEGVRQHKQLDDYDYSGEYLDELERENAQPSKKSAKSARKEKSAKKEKPAKKEKQRKPKTTQQEPLVATVTDDEIEFEADAVYELENGGNADIKAEYQAASHVEDIYKSTEEIVVTPKSADAQGAAVAPSLMGGAVSDTVNPFGSSQKSNMEPPKRFDGVKLDFEKKEEPKSDSKVLESVTKEEVAEQMKSLDDVKLEKYAGSSTTSASMAKSEKTDGDANMAKDVKPASNVGGDAEKISLQTASGTVIKNETVLSQAAKPEAKGDIKTESGAASAKSEPSASVGQANVGGVSKSANAAADGINDDAAISRSAANAPSAKTALGASAAQSDSAGNAAPIAPARPMGASKPIAPARPVTGAAVPSGAKHSASASAEGDDVLSTSKHARKAPKVEAGFDESVIYGKYVIEHEGGEYFYTLYNPSNKAVFASGNYASLDSCKKAIARFKAHARAGSAVLETKNGQYRYVLKCNIFEYRSDGYATSSDAQKDLDDVKYFAQTDIIREQ